MRTSSLGYLIKEGAKNVFHNRLMSFASIGVLTACLILIGGATLLTMNINGVVGYVEDQNEVMAFLVDSVAEDEGQGAPLQVAVTRTVLPVPSPASGALKLSHVAVYSPAPAA